MNVHNLWDAARAIQDFCNNNSWHSCFIGGIADAAPEPAPVTPAATL